jgi:hypothetical protein
MKWAGHVARLGEERGVYRVLKGNAHKMNEMGMACRVDGGGEGFGGET